MSNLDLLSGKITIRNRKLPIVWSGEIAQHITENYIKTPGSHPLLHMDIQKFASKIKKWVRASKGKTYKGYGIFDGINFVVYIVQKPQFAQIKTCFKRKEDFMDNTTISGIVEEHGLAYDDHIYQELVDLKIYDSFEDAKADLDKDTYNHIIKPRLKKKKTKVSYLS